MGGGSEWRQIQRREERRTKSEERDAPSAFASPLSPLRSPQILCLPYQPLSELSASLSAADLHLVVMGEPFVGIVHPCKIYNILAAKRRFLYIGPEESSITDLISNLSVDHMAGRASHGNVEGTIEQIESASKAE